MQGEYGKISEDIEVCGDFPLKEVLYRKGGARWAENGFCRHRASRQLAEGV